MSDEKRRIICTVDHANKHKDTLQARPYSYWLKNAEQLRTARLERPPGSFRRDLAGRKKA